MGAVLALVIANKNYSSWSMRPWTLLRGRGIPFQERMIKFESQDWRDHIGKLSPSGLVPVLWEGEPLGASPARTGTILGASRIVDDPAERARLHAATGADAVDMESGALARSGRLVGCLRAISDTPTHRLGGVAQGATTDGGVDVVGFLRGFVREPAVTVRAARGARRALRSLEKVA